MFTGIVEQTGTVLKLVRAGKEVKLQIATPRPFQLKRGDSVAVNGCCLTVSNLGKTSSPVHFEVDLLQETWDRTTFRFIVPKKTVNLERAATPTSRLGGHFVTGHIDDVGKILQWKRVRNDWLLEIQAPPPLMRYLIPKGSVALDGISLTVSRVKKSSFEVWIIPHTLQVTTLRERAVGDFVNVETDLIGKYVEKLVRRSGRKI